MAPFFIYYGTRTMKSALVSKIASFNTSIACVLVKLLRQAMAILLTGTGAANGMTLINGL